MTAKPILVAALLLAGLAAGQPAQAQGGAIAAGLDAGTVGEQVDGYLGFPHGAPGGLKAEVDALNIKRRQVYTQAAQAKNVSIEEFATSAGCNTLGKLKDGRAYSVAPGVWAVKAGGAVKLPAVCGG